MAQKPVLAVKMTTQGGNVCQRCFLSQPPEVILVHVKDTGATGGKNCCPGCVVYYKRKRAGLTNTSTLSVFEEQTAGGMKIHQNNSDSQRGTGVKKIVALGNLSGSSRKQYSNMGPPAIIPRGPNVQTPFRNNSHRGGGSLLDSFLNKVKEKGLTEGYQPVHSHYELLRRTMQTLAYSQGRTDTFTMEAQLRYMKGGKTTPELVGPSGCLETLGSIPTSAGVADLKLAALTVIYPAFKKWSYDYSISLDDVKLRSKKWVEFVPNDPDIDAVKDLCYTFTGKQPKLKSNAHITVYLSITEELHDKIEERIKAHNLDDTEGGSPQPKRQRLNSTKDQEPASASEVSNPRSDEDERSDKDRDVSDEESEPDHEVPVRKAIRRITNTQPSVFPSQHTASLFRSFSKKSPDLEYSSRPNSAGPSQSTKHTTASTPRHSAPLSENRANASQVRPESEDYDPRWLVALSGVKKIGRNAVSELLSKTTTISATVYYADLCLEDLLNNPDILDDPQSSNAFSSTLTTFEFPEDPKIHYGAFKLAFKARSSEPLFASGTRIVCMKQVYYTSQSTGAKKPCDAARQVHDLLAELTCLIWAKCLLDLTYKSIRKMRDFSAGVPTLRFAKAGLAISQDPSGTRGTTVYLVEEYIPSAEGTFRKYINNASAVPLVDALPKDYHQQARFLSFAQHMQYVKTDGLAYVSDLQGSLSTLTDPQIITAMKTNFAKGNINHGKFEGQHLCNDFCKWFGLSPFASQLEEDERPEYVASSGEDHAFGSKAASPKQLEIPSTPTQSPPTAATGATGTKQGKARGRPRGRGRGATAMNTGSNRVLRSKAVPNNSVAPSDMDISVDASPA